MEEQSTHSNSVRKVRLVRRFNVALVRIYLLSLLISAPVIYYYTRQQVHEQANEELRLMVDVVKSVQAYIIKDVRPYLMEKRVFYPPAISGIAATSRVAGHLKSLQPRYVIRNASDNPLNPNNNANDLEYSLLERFRADRGLREVVQEGLVEGEPYLVASAPKNTQKGCLRCHGDPQTALREVVNAYGTTSGYNQRVGGVAGVSLVGVPLADVKTLAIERSLYVFAAVTALFALLFTVVNLLIRRLVVRPILDITETARAVSQGDVNRVIITDGEHEISDLAHSFEMMRRSVVAAMKHMRNG